MTDAEIALYEHENRAQDQAEYDTFTVERYRQFLRHLSSGAHTVLDVGCATGRGGEVLATARPTIELWGLDVVQSRLDALPDAYLKRIRGLSTELPIEDQCVDAVVAGEFLEHLQARDVDPTLCEFQRVLRVGGRLLLTTPNPRSLLRRATFGTVYEPGHLTQHYAGILKQRLLAHGFRKVKIYGTGKASRHIGTRVPFLPLYGSYLIRADKR